MASREVFRNPLTGRFVSAEQAASLESALRLVYADGELQSSQALAFGQVVDEIVGTVQNWQQEPSRWGTRWHADEDPLDLYGVQQTPFPDGYDSFKVWYFVDDNPDYPRGYASGGWMTSDQWPPSLDAESFNPTGISQIVFRRG